MAPRGLADHPSRGAGPLLDGLDGHDSAFVARLDEGARRVEAQGLELSAVKGPEQGFGRPIGAAAEGHAAVLADARVREAEAGLLARDPVVGDVGQGPALEVVAGRVLDLDRDRREAIGKTSVDGDAESPGPGLIVLGDDDRLVGGAGYRELRRCRGVRRRDRALEPLAAVDACLGALGEVPRALRGRYAIELDRAGALVQDVGEEGRVPGESVRVDGYEGEEMPARGGGRGHEREGLGAGKLDRRGPIEGPADGRHSVVVGDPAPDGLALAEHRGGRGLGLLVRARGGQRAQHLEDGLVGLAVDPERCGQLHHVADRILGHEGHDGRVALDLAGVEFLGEIGVALRERDFALLPRAEFVGEALDAYRVPDRAHDREEAVDRPILLGPRHLDRRLRVVDEDEVGGGGRRAHTVHAA